MPETTYFETIGILAARGYYNIALTIIKDKVNLKNIDLAIENYNNSIKPWHEVNYDCYQKVKEVLMKIKVN